MATSTKKGIKNITSVPSELTAKMVCTDRHSHDYRTRTNKRHHHLLQTCGRGDEVWAWQTLMFMYTATSLLNALEYLKSFYEIALLCVCFHFTLCGAPHQSGDPTTSSYPCGRRALASANYIMPAVERKFKCECTPVRA